MPIAQTTESDRGDERQDHRLARCGTPRSARARSRTSASATSGTMPRVAPFSAASAGGWPPTQISVRASRSLAASASSASVMSLGGRVVLEVGEDHRAARVGRDEVADVHRVREDALAQRGERPRRRRASASSSGADAHRAAVRRAPPSRSARSARARSPARTPGSAATPSVSRRMRAACPGRRRRLRARRSRRSRSGRRRTARAGDRRSACTDGRAASDRRGRPRDAGGAARTRAAR